MLIARFILDILCGGECAVVEVVIPAGLLD
jgi:hypothetical protein